VTFNNLHTYY